MTPDNDRQCQATTQAGTRCTRTIVGIRYCERHRELEVYNGGPGERPSTSADLAAPVRTTGDALRRLNQINAALVRGEITPVVATTLSRNIQLAVRASLVATEDDTDATDVDGIDDMTDAEAMALLRKVYG